jgi:hypothetical protein
LEPTKNMLLAQDLDQIQTGAFPNATPLSQMTPGGIIGSTLPYVFSVAAILLLIYLVTAGLSMMLSRGDPKAMQAAQAKITNALIGFVIVILAFFIVQLLGRILGLQTNSPFSQTFGIK